MAGAGSRGGRLFFALWPDAATATDIDARAASLAIRGRRIARRRLHMTLAYHGPSDAAQARALVRRAEAIRVPAFDLMLDRCGGFERAGVAWLGPASPPSALHELASLLAPEGLDSAAFVPHVTIARRAEPPSRTSIAPLPWAVTGFHLVESAAGARSGAYRSRGYWPLTPRPIKRAGV